MELPPNTRRALDACYDAVIAPSQWIAALDELAHSLGARGCIILPHDINDREYGVVCSTDIERLHERWLRNLDWVQPVFEQRGDPYVRRGDQSVIQSQLFSDEELRKSRYHNEISGPAGMREWSCGIFATEGRHWCLPFFKGGEPYTTDVLAPLAEVSRQVARIVSISEKFTRSSADNEIRTLERMGRAAVLLDRFGRAVKANHLAERLFCSDFGIRHGRLWAASAASLARLDSFIGAIAQIDSPPRWLHKPRDGFGFGNELPLPIVIARDSQPWLLIEAMPVASISAEFFNGHRAILVISDMTHASFRDDGMLSRAFGLTIAEARLAVALCQGHDLADTAATFGISLLTARSQLKTIFSKTGTRRQAELVARLVQIKSVSRH